jgi:hypothetical protein
VVQVDDLIDYNRESEVPTRRPYSTETAQADPFFQETTAESFVVR